MDLKSYTRASPFNLEINSNLERLSGLKMKCIIKQLIWTLKIISQHTYGVLIPFFTLSRIQARYLLTKVKAEKKDNHAGYHKYWNSEAITQTVPTGSITKLEVKSIHCHFKDI